MSVSRFHPSKGRVSKRELLRHAKTMSRWRKAQSARAEQARHRVKIAVDQFIEVNNAHLDRNLPQTIGHHNKTARPGLHLSGSHTESTSAPRMFGHSGAVKPAPQDIPDFIKVYLRNSALTLRDLSELTIIQALHKLTLPHIIDLLGDKLHHLMAYIYSLSIAASSRNPAHKKVERQIFEWALCADQPVLQEQAVLTFEYYFPHSIKSQLIVENGNFARVIIEPGPRITRRLLHQVHPSKGTRETSRHAFAHDHIQAQLLTLGFDKESVNILKKLTSKRPMGRRRRYANQLSALIDKFKGKTAAHQSYRDYINGLLKLIPVSSRGLNQLNDFLHYTISIPDELLAGILEEAPTWTHQEQIENEISRLIQWHESHLLEHLLMGSPSEAERDILNDLFGEEPSTRASQVLNEFFHSSFLESIISSCIFMNRQGRANLRRLICAVYQDNLDFRSFRIIQEIFGIPVTHEFWQQWSANHWFKTSIPEYGSIVDEISDLALAIRDEMSQFQTVVLEQKSLLPISARTFIEDYNSILHLMETISDPSTETNHSLIKICDAVNHFIQEYKPYSNYLLTLFQNAGHFPGLLHKLSSMRLRILKYLNNDLQNQDTEFYFEVTHDYVRQIHLGDHPHANCLSTKTPMGPNIDGDMYKRPLSPFCANVILSKKTDDSEIGVVAFCDIEIRFIEGEPHLLVDLDYTSSEFIQIHAFRNLIYGYAYETLNIPPERIHMYYKEYDLDRANEIPTLAETLAEVDTSQQKAKLAKAYDVFRDFFLM